MRKITMATAALLLMNGCGGGGGGNTAAPGALAGGDDGVTLTADIAIGAKYGSSGPRKCSSMKSPETGIPTGDVIAKYVICTQEGVSGESLVLEDQVMVGELAAPRAYNPQEDINMPGIDPSKPVIAFKGSLVTYRCNELQQPGQDFGKQYQAGSNCYRKPEPDASGFCFQNNFADWTCKMVDFNGTLDTTEGVAAPH